MKISQWRNVKTLLVTNFGRTQNDKQLEEADNSKNVEQSLIIMMHCMMH